VTTTEKPLHIQQADGLRALADMIEQNPAVAPMMLSTLPRMLVSVGHLGDPSEELLAFLRAGGSAARKNYDSDNWMAVDVDFGAVGLYVYTSRDQVCERVVTGTETVTKLVPDPAAPMVEVTEQVEQVEWRCSSLLAAEKASAVAL
jgi:hypothetical protein